MHIKPQEIVRICKVIYIHRSLSNQNRIQEWRAAIVNTLIQKIGIFNPVKVDGVKHVSIKIHITAVGVLDLPDEAEILKIRQEIAKTKKNSA